MLTIDIEMPIYCYDCPCHNGENGRCNITGDSTFDKRPFDCPLKEVKLADLPSTQPERKKGKWTVEGHHPNYLLRCSACQKIAMWAGGISYIYPNFCPHCGADMETDDE